MGPFALIETGSGLVYSGYMKIFRNTAQKGSVRCIVFKERKVWYAVALEFNIVEYAEDPQVALGRLVDAMTGYLESFKSIKGARPDCLNQTPEPEYEEMWNKLESGKPVKSPYQVYMHSEVNLGALSRS